MDAAVPFESSLATCAGIEEGEFARDFFERLHRLRIKDTGFGWWRWLVHASDPVNAAPCCGLIQHVWVHWRDSADGDDLFTD